MLHPASGRPTVFVDADNTLWDTDGVFAAAQLRLFEDVGAALPAIRETAAPLEFLRHVDQAIAERHHDGLRYPPILLVRALERALAGETADAAARAACRGRHAYQIDGVTAEEIVSRYLEGLSTLPELRRGVRDGLSEMRRCGFRLLIVTESAQSRVEARAAAHGISGHFERVVEGRKGAELYRRVLALSRATGPVFMVGDQVDRDVLPARTAGLGTILFPGGFQPRWNVPASGTLADHVIEDFAEVPAIVDAARSIAAAESLI